MFYDFCACELLIESITLLRHFSSRDESYRRDEDQGDKRYLHLNNHAFAFIIFMIFLEYYLWNYYNYIHAFASRR